MASALRLWSTYWALAGARVRGDWQYRTSTVLLFATTALGNALEFVAILVLLHHVPALDGFDTAEMGLLYGTAQTSLALGDIALGQAEKVGVHIRSGAFDRMLLRPVSTLLQAATDTWRVYAVGKLVQASAVLAWALAAAGIDWSASKVLALALGVASGAVVMGALFVLGAAFTVVAVDAKETMNAVTYGGGYMASYPLSIYGDWFRRAFLYAVPLAFLSWRPVLNALERPDPLGLPGWTLWAGPPVAASMSVLAGLAWRSAVRRYRSTGS